MTDQSMNHWVAPSMTHQELVDALRSIDGVRDVGHGAPNFHFRSRPFVHFHEYEDGTFADVRFGSGDFEPVRVATSGERLELLSRVLDHVERLDRSSKRDRRGHRTSGSRSRGRRHTPSLRSRE